MPGRRGRGRPARALASRGAVRGPSPRRRRRETERVRVTFLRVRGSTPAPGPTSSATAATRRAWPSSRRRRPAARPRCCSMRAPGSGGSPRSSAAGPFAGTILLTHLHWDHVRGCRSSRPATAPAPGSPVAAAPDDGGGRRGVLARMMSPPFFPIRPANSAATGRSARAAGRVRRRRASRVTAREVPHKGGRTFGYRVSDGRSTLAYMPDHCPTELGAGPDGWASTTRPPSSWPRTSTSSSTTPTCCAEEVAGGGVVRPRRGGVRRRARRAGRGATGGAVPSPPGAHATTRWTRTRRLASAPRDRSVLGGRRKARRSRL